MIFNSIRKTFIVSKTLNSSTFILEYWNRKIQQVIFLLCVNFKTECVLNCPAVNSLKAEKCSKPLQIEERKNTPILGNLFVWAYSVPAPVNVEIDETEEGSDGDLPF